MAITPTTAQLQALVHKINAQHRLQSAHTLRGGIAAEVMMLECFTETQQIARYVLRWYEDTDLSRNYHVVGQEYQVLTTLKKLGMPVPTPYLVDASGEIFPFAYLVMAFVAGKPQFISSNINGFVEELARHLVQLHQLDQSQLQFPFINDKHIEMMAPPVASNELAIKAKIRQALTPYLPVTYRNSKLFLHGDFWLGNLLWKDGQLTAMIDWEDMVYADPLYEIAVTRLNLMWAFGPDAMQNFTKAYHQMMPHLDLTQLPLWDLYVALRTPDNFPEWADGWIDYERADVNRQTFLDDYHEFVKLAFGQLKSQ